MKTLTVGTLITGMYQSPVIALLITIILVFIADLYRQYSESKRITWLDASGIYVKELEQEV